MEKSKLMVVAVIFTIFTTSTQAYSGSDFGNDVINAIQGAWQIWKDYFWVG